VRFLKRAEREDVYGLCVVDRSGRTGGEVEVLHADLQSLFGLHVT
jgi:hypothetical protein